MYLFYKDFNLNYQWWRLKVLPLSVWNIKEPTDTAEDADRIPYITKRKDALLADLAPELKWEDMMVGHRKLELEEVKEPEEWDTWKISQEKLKMDSDLEPPPSQLKEKPNDWLYWYMQNNFNL